MKQIANIKSSIGNLFYEILLIDVTQEYSFNKFLDGAIGLARLIEVSKPEPNRKLVDKISYIEQQGYLEMDNKTGSKEEFQNVIRKKSHNTFVIANIRRDIKEKICGLIQEILTEERILEE